MCRAAGTEDLHETEPLLVSGVELEKTLESAEALEDSLGVVNAIDTHSEERGLDTHLGAKRGAFFAGAARFADRVRILRKRHADGIGAHPRDVALPVHGEAVPLRKRFERAVHRLQKIVAVRLNMKADEISAEATIDELALPRTDPKNLRVRPANMPQDRHSGVGPRVLDHPRQQREVIILREKNRRFGALHFLQNDVRKPAIDFLILQPVLWTKDPARVRNGRERPQPFI